MAVVVTVVNVVVLLVVVVVVPLVVVVDIVVRNISWQELEYDVTTLSVLQQFAVPIISWLSCRRSTLTSKAKLLLQ